MTLVRVGPVHFQALEQELEAVARYLSGHMLNAGCGTRDISPYLRANGVAEITRYDIASDDADVIVGPLESMRFADDSFDSVLCNAVLEHVQNAERAIRELARVVQRLREVRQHQPQHGQRHDHGQKRIRALQVIGLLAVAQPAKQQR